MKKLSNILFITALICAIVAIIIPVVNNFIHWNEIQTPKQKFFMNIHALWVFGCGFLCYYFGKKIRRYK